LVEDDATIVRSLEPAILVHGYDLTVSGTTSEAIAHLKQGSWSAVILDLGLPDQDGSAVLHHVAQSCRTPTIVISARNTIDAHQSSIAAGARFFMHKPFRTALLMDNIAKAVRLSTDD
jgi:two-component system OmpR family response regulator/two-component system response regulator QseB